MAYSASNEIVGEVTEHLGQATNNEAEFVALILGLLLVIKCGAKEISVFGDSQFITNLVNGFSLPRASNVKAFLSLFLEVVANFQSSSFNHVYRSQNKKADSLANAALNYHRSVYRKFVTRYWIHKLGIDFPT